MTTSRLPFCFHVLFHPDSNDARAVAASIRKSLCGDVRIPGLRIPVFLLPEDGTGFPTQLNLKDADHSVVIALIDNELIFDRDVRSGNIAWPEFVANVRAACEALGHRFIPVQLSVPAWPCHPSMRNCNFVRAVDSDAAARWTSLERRILVETGRYLLGMDHGTKVPIRLFLSHAKHDLKVAPRVFDLVTEHLAITQPVESWIDSAKIEPGGDFGKAIEEGVKECAVLILNTSSYSSRPWCRREVLFAKRHQRPVVVLDALSGIDSRSFPYTGNVPVIGWSDDAPRVAVDMLLKEVIRIEHQKRLLDRHAKSGDVTLVCPPELLTLTSLPKNSVVLYPDPPLGDEEFNVVSSLGHRLETPLQRAGQARFLSKRTIAISISESDDILRFGLFPEQVGEVLVEVSRHLLAHGANLAYGGHLGSEGYTIQLFDLVREFGDNSALPAVERIINYVGWPLPYFRPDLAIHQAGAVFRRIPRPAGLEALDPVTFAEDLQVSFPDDSGLRRFAWARGMTEMRARQSEEVDARIVIGGRTMPPYKGRIPGVVEEVLLSLRAGKAVYVAGAYGGAGAMVIDLLEGRPCPQFTWEEQSAARFSDHMRELYKAQGLAWEGYPSMTRYFRELGVKGLSRLNGLTEDENREMFFSRDMLRLVELLLRGLRNSRIGDPAAPAGTPRVKKAESRRSTSKKP